MVRDLQIKHTPLDGVCNVFTITADGLGDDSKFSIFISIVAYAALRRWGFFCRLREFPISWRTFFAAICGIVSDFLCICHSDIADLDPC